MASTPDDIACNEVVELVTDFLEGALPASEARRVAAHLEGCPGCDEYLAQMRALSGSLGGLDTESIRPATRDALLDAFRDEL